MNRDLSKVIMIDTKEEHAHGQDCGHEAVQHDGHVDYLHDGHKHAEHEDHYDEH